MKAEEVHFLNGNVLQNYHGGLVLIATTSTAATATTMAFPICVELKTGKIKWGR